MRFSERYGHSVVRDSIQIDGLDDGTRRRLWNIISPLIPSGYFSGLSGNNKHFLEELWDKYFKLVVTDLLGFQNNWEIYNLIRKYFMESNWYICYDFIESLIEFYFNPETIERFITQCNIVLEEEKCGYRIAGKLVVPIINEEEVSEVEAALNTPFEAVNEHIQTALNHLSDKQEPDYRNSIKESISAVECICKIIIGDRNTTLGQALRRLEEAGVELHPALRDGFSKLYGWTGANEGIRHAMMDMSTVDQDDARYMLVTCSAFVNYLLAEANKAGIDLQANWEAIR